MMKRSYPILMILSLWLFTACATIENQLPYRFSSRSSHSSQTGLKTMGYSVQVGAFGNVNNAARLSNTMSDLGAYYYKQDTGLYKVRFGNYNSWSSAYSKALALKEKGLINDFYIVRPVEYNIVRYADKGDNYLRGKLAQTASNFIGVPYKWGGTSASEGFDCSGLTQAIYQLNGLDLPRASRDQFQIGQPVPRDNLEIGDLVFFNRGGSGGVNHVGIYVGENRFIHAPGNGQTIRTDTLDKDYYRRSYMGARRYMADSSRSSQRSQSKNRQADSSD